MKTLLKKDIIFYILSLFSIILITFFTVIFSKYNVIEHDDALGMFYEKYWTFMEKAFYNAYKGKWISSFFLKMTGSVIPIKLGIHPVIWIQTGGAVIKGLFYSLFAFCLAKCLFIYRRKDVFLPITAFICYLFVQIQLLGLYQNELYCSFYSFTFNFIFYFCFWILFIKRYLIKSNIDIKLSIFAFILGMTSELTAFGSVISLYLIFFYDLLKNKKYNKFVFSQAFSITVGSILYFLNPGFHSDFVNKTNEGILNSIKPSVIEVLKDLLSLCTIEYIIYFLIMIILFVLIIKFHKNDKKILFVISSMLSGGLAFYLLMSFVRDKNMGYLYLIHFDVLLNMKILFLCVIFLELAILFKENNEKIFKTLVIIALLVSITSLVYKNPKIYHDENYYKKRYLDERILAFYAYQNKIPVTYSSIGSYSIYSVYARRIYNSEFTQENVILKDKLEDVYNIYINNGGCEINNEEIDKADFQMLLDKEAVLRCNTKE